MKKNISLDKTEERILKYINGFEEVDIGEFAGFMPEVSDEEINFYINELVKGLYIKRSSTMSRICLDEKGKQYLKENLSSESDDSVPEKKDIKTKKNDNPFICDPNFYGVGIKGDKFVPWIKEIFKHITKHFSGRR